MALLKSSVLQLLVGVSLTGVTAALLYLLLGKDEEDEVEGVVGAIKTSRSTVLELKIPKDCVGVVIGRAGANVKEIQEKSDTKINFKDEQEGDSNRICVIRGTPESAQYAESLIREFISNQPLIEVSTMTVPQKACGRIIGRNGDNIRSMSRASCAKINVESNSGNSRSATVRITLKGTADQIELAKSLITEKVEEDAEIRKKLENLNSRSPRRKENPLAITAEGENRVGSDSSSVEKLVAVSSDGTLEVFVSAVHSPDCFWVQIKGPRAVDLDVLVDKMTDYYSREENRELHAIETVKVNSLVAALFNYDQKWYRAKVVEIKDDEYDPANSEVEVYYVDYGDVAMVKKDSVLRLRTDFLTLRFQAIESALARVDPVSGVWTTEAIDAFERLVKVARWEALTARVETTRTKSGIGHGSRMDDSDSGHHPIPCIDLYETRTSQDISIAEELVKMGFAEWRRETPERKSMSPVNRPNFKKDAASPKTPESPRSEDSKTEVDISLEVTNNTNGGRSTEQPTIQEKSTTTKYPVTGRKVGIDFSKAKFLPPDFSEGEESDELEMG